jgi:hypothetical protein
MLSDKVYVQSKLREMAGEHELSPERAMQREALRRRSVRAAVSPLSAFVHCLTRPMRALRLKMATRPDVQATRAPAVAMVAVHQSTARGKRLRH